MQTIIHPSALLVHAKIAWLALLPAVCLPMLQAQLNIPSDGLDGALRFGEGALTPNISIVEGTNAVIDLSMAVTGVWDDSNLDNAGLGIYDPDQWAVVFKYTSVEIPAGMNVSFKNHPSYAPVVWLVKDSVEIQAPSLLNLSGQWVRGWGSIEHLVPSEPGSGGFRGFAHGPSGTGASFGPGSSVTYAGPSGYRSFYGNPAILPLIGGGGGYGRPDGLSNNSVGGGGAILIAAANDVLIDGKILS